MTDYLGYTADEYAPDAPATSLHFRRWFENWIAAFEAAPGAPRIEPRALKNPFVGNGSFNSGAPLAFIGLAGAEVINCTIASQNGTGSTNSIGVAFSNDNGSTWGAVQTMPPAMPTQATQLINAIINLRTGVISAVGINVFSSSQTNNIGSATLTVPASCNAIRFSSGSGGFQGTVQLCILGGRT